MHFLRASLFKWILNPEQLISTLIGANFTVDTTAFRADHTGHTSDNITV